MSSPASDSNNFYSTTGHILFPILGVVGGLILLIGGYAMWRGPHRQFLPCFNRRKREPLSDDAANQTRRDMRYWGEENALTPMSGPGGGRRGSYFAAQQQQHQHQQQPYAKRPVRQDSGPRSGSGAAQVKREYRQSQAQYGIPGGPDVGYGYGPGSGAGSGLGHGQHGYGVDLEAGDVVGQAMLGSAMNGGDDYDAYHAAAYGRRRSDRSRSSDGSGSGSAARSRSSTLVTSDTNAYGYALQPKIVEEPLESPGGLGTPYDADRDARSGTGSPAPLLSGSTGGMRSNGSASPNGDYFAVPPPRSNPFGTPTNDPTLLAPAQIGSQGMIRSPGFAPPAHHYAQTPTLPSAAQKQANGPGRALAGGAQGGPPARPRRGSYARTPLAHGEGQSGAFRPANGAGASGRPADTSRQMEEADADLQIM